METNSGTGSIFDVIRKDIQENKVMLYMKGTPDQPQCGFSARVVEILRELDVQQIGYKNVMADVSIRQGIKEFSNWPTIPQLYINGEFIGGCDITSEMYASGELKSILSK